MNLTEGLVERLRAGEMSACAEFVELNKKFLCGWARKCLRDYTNIIPKNEYEEDDLINQIFADFLYYDFSSVAMIIRSIYRSYRGVAYGGYKANTWGMTREERLKSLDAPLSVSKRNGESEDGATLKDTLPSPEPPPDIILEKKEHIREIAPRYFHEIGRLFPQTESEYTGGATIGEMLAYSESKREKQVSEFQDVIEEVFFGYTFEEVEGYANARAV